jgi:hypothetical protein
LELNITRLSHALTVVAFDLRKEWVVK